MRAIIIFQTYVRKISKMTPLELLEQDLYDRGILVIYDRPPDGVKGLCLRWEKGHLIILSDALQTSAERLSVLAEEAGHYHTSTGDILSLDDVWSRKQELRARAWAYDQYAGPEKLITAWREGIRTPWELAEYLGVTEEFLISALKYYAGKYGPVWHVDRYLIRFEPFTIRREEDEGIIEKAHSYNRRCCSNRCDCYCHCVE